MIRALFIVGTRPEAIKVAPIVLAMRDGDGGIKPVVCLTGQHPQMAREAFDVFGLAEDLCLDCVPPGGDLCRTAAGVIAATGCLLDDLTPDLVVVQGDTLSAFAGGLAAVLRGLPLAHVEAGLRSGRFDNPFPEEISRRQLSHLARWNFAPTQTAVDNLLAEGVDPAGVHLVGNTVIDAVRIVRSTLPTPVDAGHKVILVTVHRRENWGDPMRQVCQAVKALADRHADWRFVFSVHPNPAVQRSVRAELEGVDRVTLLNAPRYDQWVRQMIDCDLILTDSGGMQEEGAALGRPVIVLRKTTERPEAVQAGTAVVAGTDSSAVTNTTERIMADPKTYAAMARPTNVFGDGHASQHIVSILLQACNRQPAPSPAEPISA